LLRARGMRGARRSARPWIGRPRVGRLGLRGAIEIRDDLKLA
jgi:hypothetical protein